MASAPALMSADAIGEARRVSATCLRDLPDGKRLSERIMEKPQRDRRRATFDDVAELYDAVRLAYPPTLIEDLLERTRLGDGSRVLEIGCGTGQLTVPLAEQGCEILAVELGANLAAVARRKLSRFDCARVVVANFEEWSLPDVGFDLVVAATSFHWLDPATRVEKCARTLRPGGIFAIVETHWGAGSGADEFFRKTQSCYARWDPNHRPDFVPATLETLPKTHRELEESKLFSEIELCRYSVERRHDAVQYCDLLRTFSDVRALDESARDGLLRCIGNLIDSEFGGSIIRTDAYSLWLAKKADVIDCTAGPILREVGGGS